MPVSDGDLMSPAQPPLHASTRSPVVSGPVSRGVTAVSDPSTSSTTPLVAFRRSGGVPPSSAASAGAVVSSPPLLSRTSSPVVTGVRIGDAPTRTPASPGTTVPERVDGPEEVSRGSLPLSDRPTRTEPRRISRDVVPGPGSAVAGTERAPVRDDVIDVDRGAPLPLAQPSPTGEVRGPIDRTERQSAAAIGSTDVRDPKVPRVARSMSGGGTTPVLSGSGGAGTSQEPPDFTLPLTRLEPARLTRPSALLTARSASAPGIVSGIGLGPAGRTSVGAAGTTGRSPIAVAGTPSTGMLVARVIARPPVVARDSTHLDAGSTRHPSPDESVAVSAAQPAAAAVVGPFASDSAPAASRDVFDGRVRAAGLPPMLLAMRSVTLRSTALLSTAPLSTALPSTPLPSVAPHSIALHPGAVQSMALRSTAMVRPELMRAPQSRAVERPHDAGRGAAERSELVLVARTADADGRVMAIQRVTPGIVPGAAPVSSIPDGGRAPAVADPRRAETPAAGAKPQIDLDELVDKAWQKLMRKVAIEQERRGYTRGPWQS